MHPLTSFLAASGLAILDLGILALVTARVGTSPKGRQAVLLSMAVVLKLGILVAGAAWLSKQPWNDRHAMMLGLLAPFVLFIAWQVLSLRIRASRRA